MAREYHCCSLTGKCCGQSSAPCGVHINDVTVCVWFRLACFSSGFFTHGIYIRKQWHLSLTVCHIHVLNTYYLAMPRYVQKSFNDTFNILCYVLGFWLENTLVSIIGKQPLWTPKQLPNTALKTPRILQWHDGIMVPSIARALFRKCQKSSCYCPASVSSNFASVNTRDTIPFTAPHIFCSPVCPLTWDDKSSVSHIVFFVLWLESRCLLHIQHLFALQGWTWIHKKSPNFSVCIASFHTWADTRRANEYLAGSPLCADKSQFLKGTIANLFSQHVTLLLKLLNMLPLKHASRQHVFFC